MAAALFFATSAHAAVASARIGGAASATHEAGHASQPAVRRTASGLTRVRGTVRPFFNALGSGGGVIADVTVEHYFHAPFKLGLSLSPVALAAQSGGAGAVTHLRLEAAFATRYLEVGAAVGTRVENFGPAGASLAAKLRLGPLDGLNLALTYGYAGIRNRYTGRGRVAFSNLLAAVEVPLLPRLSVVIDAGFSMDAWLYGTAGLKHRLAGDGGPGTWIVLAAFGLAWVQNGFPCQYVDPERCQGTAWGIGPTIAVGVERRF